MNYPFYKVGGCVRDDILGTKSKDIDYAVEAPSFDAMREAIITRGGQIFVETPKYFTIRANVPKLGACDYALCREDGPYTDGRHPDWVKPSDIWHDLERRDFTMNAIAVTEKGEILDPHCGVQDIESRKIRAVGNPVQRLTEDKLRAFRAIRFAVTKGFNIDPELAAAIEKLHVRDFEGVTTERIREELFKMFTHNSHDSIMLLVNTFFNLWRVVLSRNIHLVPVMSKP